MVRERRVGVRGLKTPQLELLDAGSAVAEMPGAPAAQGSTQQTTGIKQLPLRVTREVIIPLIGSDTGQTPQIEFGDALK
jgi:hypothetical protein